MQAFIKYHNLYRCTYVTSEYLVHAGSSIYAHDISGFVFIDASTIVDVTDSANIKRPSLAIYAINYIP